MQISGSTYSLSSPNANSSNQSNRAEIGETDFSFWDMLDVINPLQHIPVLSKLYRAATGDEIGSVSNIIGGALFGGPIGGSFAIAQEISADSDGNDQAIEQPIQLASYEPTANAQSGANSYAKIRTTTADWLNPNFGAGSAAIAQMV